MADQVDLKAFVHGFILEADEHLHAVNRNLVSASEALQRQRAEPRAVRELLRSFHTIKGLASMVGVEGIVTLSHEMEGVLRLADQAGGRLSDRHLDLILRGTRAIEERVRALEHGGIPGVAPAPPALLEALSLAQNEPNPPSLSDTPGLRLPDDILKGLSPSEIEQVRQAPEQGRRAVLIEFQPSSDRVARGLTITTMRARLAELADIVKIVPRAAPGSPTGIAFCILAITSHEISALAERLESDEAAILEVTPGRPMPPALPDFSEVGSADWVPSADHASIRVDIRKLDEALERLTGLVVTRSKLSLAAQRLASNGADTRELSAIVAEYARELKRLRAAITQARMVPLSELLQRLPLVARGLTQQGGKAVTVSVQAGTAEVDKAVADRLFPALIHLVRNAVDHAVEPREERARSGKPEGATLTVICDDSSGTSLVVTVRDDGTGIDREAVARKAGLPVAASDEELLDQITLPGLSTRESTTQTSGRGMGMDIVRRTVEALGGTLSLSTARGKGTAFTLRVPVSLTIVDVLSFTCADQAFVAPIAMIEEIMEVSPSGLVASPRPQREGIGSYLIQRRGQAIPFCPLEALLGRPISATPPTKALVVRYAGGALALGVDRLLGQQEVVVRPLQNPWVNLKGMAGATDLGDGRPTLVLDLASLGTTLLQKTG